jgi:hypothetical protein
MLSMKTTALQERRQHLESVEQRYAHKVINPLLFQKNWVGAEGGRSCSWSVNSDWLF